MTINRVNWKRNDHDQHNTVYRKTLIRRSLLNIYDYFVVDPAVLYVYQETLNSSQIAKLYF